MTTTEIIAELQKLVDRNGDCEFHLYKAHDKKIVESNLDIFFDDFDKDICIGFYD